MYKAIRLWLKENSPTIAHLAAVLGVVAGICIALNQFDQIDRHRKWQNFNDMNIRYANLFIQMHEKIIEGGTPFEKLEPRDQLWIRQYFDLTSEEYWLHEKDLIPEDMWEKRIMCGVIVNLRKYPVLKEGYYYWQGEGLFAHPEKFRSEFEEAIATEKACAKN